MLIDDVHAMPAHLSVDAPGELDVHSFARRAPRPDGRPARGAAAHDERKHAEEQQETKLGRMQQNSTHTTQLKSDMRV